MMEIRVQGVHGTRYIFIESYVCCPGIHPEFAGITIEECKFEITLLAFPPSVGEQADDTCKQHQDAAWLRNTCHAETEVCLLI
jgi:hypothetical protein